MKCTWCRRDVDGPILYHVCPDGTDYAQRWGKTAKEFDDEYARQDRCAAGLAKWEWTPNTKIVHKKDITPAFAWTADDDRMLKGMKIKWDDWDTH